MERFVSLISAVLDTFVTKSTEAAERLAPHGKVYLRLLRRLTVFAFLPPLFLLPLVFFGGTMRDVALLAIVILWSLLTLLLAFAASPLGLVVDVLRGGIFGGGC